MIQQFKIGLGLGLGGLLAFYGYPLNALVFFAFAFMLASWTDEKPRYAIGVLEAGFICGLFFHDVARVLYLVLYGAA